MKRILKILSTTILIAALSGNAALSNSESELKWIVSTMAKLCLIGGDQFSVSLSSVVAGEITVQSISTSGTVEGEFQIERQRAEGLVNGIDNSITQIAASQASEVRNCLAPLRQYLMDRIIAKDGAETDGRIPAGADMQESTEAVVTGHDKNRSDDLESDRVREQLATPVMKAKAGTINEDPRGFDCSKSSMSMDFVICKYQEVYDINTQHAIAWWDKMRTLTRHQKDLLIEDQRSWIRRMLQDCNLPINGRPSQRQILDAGECVRNHYIERTAVIRNY